MSYAQRWQLAVALKQPYPTIQSQTGAIEGTGWQTWRPWALVGAIAVAGGGIGFAVGRGKGAAIGAAVGAAGVVAVMAGGALIA